jgi:hypothetical protein
MFSWQNQYGLVSDNSRIIRGSNAGGGVFSDRIDDFRAPGGANSSVTGFRIASLVPAPATLPVASSLLCLMTGRRRCSQ